MTLVLKASDFTNNVYVIKYSNRQATFTIVNESIVSSTGAAVDIKRILCTVRVYDDNGELVDEVLGSLVIGIGDDYVSATTDNTAILGTLMTEDTMSSCTVELYE